MILLRYLLVFARIALLVGAAAILALDLYQIFKFRRKTPEELGELQQPGFRWKEARYMATVSLAPLLAGLSIAVVPSGSAGVRVNQFAGTRPGTLYPGVHLAIPLVEEVELFNVRDIVFATQAVDDPKKQDGMRVQTREGLTIGLALAVRYRLDPSKLAYIQANLPQPIEEEVIAPAIASAFRDLAPGYLVRELFSTKREEVRAAAGARIAAKLGADGIVVKEVVLRDMKLPEEYAKGLEGLLLKEQENERLNIVLDVKRKEVQTAQLEAEAQKAREVTAADARAQMVVLEAKGRPTPCSTHCL